MQHFDVSKAVHIKLQLLSLLEGSWQPTVSELDQLLDHLTTCPLCQTFLGACIEVQKNEERRWKEKTQENVNGLLSSLERSVHETLLVNDVSTYIETIEMAGEDKARERFPALGKHIETCTICQADIRETRALLLEVEEVDSIESPVNTRC